MRIITPLLKKFNSNKSIKTKVFFVLLLASIIPLLLFAVISYFFMITGVMGNIRANLLDKNYTSKLLLDKKIQAVTDTVKELSNDNSLMISLELDLNQAVNELAIRKKKEKSLSFIVIQNASGVTVSDMGRSLDMDQVFGGADRPEPQTFFSKISKEAAVKLGLPPGQPPEVITITSLKRVFSDKGVLRFSIYAGYCFTNDPSIEDFYKEIGRLTKSEIVLVFDEKMHFQNSQGIFQSKDFQAPEGLDFIELELNGQTFIFTFSPFSTGTEVPLWVGNGLNTSVFQVVRAMVLGLFLFFSGLALILVLLAAYFLSATIVKPLEAMNRTIARVETGFLDESMPVFSMDEIGHLAKAFNLMMGQLANTIETLKFEIEERGKKESELKNVKTLLSNIINSMPSMLVCIDHEHKILLWNAMAETLTGIPAEKAQGMNIFSMVPDLISSAEDLPLPFGILGQKVYQKKFITLNQEQRVLKITIYPVASEGFSGAVIRADDITEQKEQEKMLIQAQKMETVGTLAGGFAHDFNNVLAGIIGTLSIMEHTLAREDQIPRVRLQEYITLMNHASQRAAGVIRQLLTFSRKMDPEFTLVQLRDNIQNILKVASTTFDKSVRLEFEALPEDDCTIHGDPVQIDQILLNLCINAAHAMTIMRGDQEPWGGTLKIILDSVQDFALLSETGVPSKKGDFCRVTISDTGVGMTPDVLEKIYLPFFTTKEKGLGTGIGLSMVYRLIHAHSGLIQVDSTPGQGTIFTLYFPKNNSGAIKPPVLSQNQVQRPERKTVLVIDDDPDVLTTAKDMLVLLGYQGLMAQGSEEGLGIFRDRVQNTDLVIMDLLMPGLSGAELFQKLKDVGPQVPVVLSSGFKQDPRVDQLLKLGVKAFLAKPYTLEEMNKVLRQVLVLKNEV